MTPIKWNEETSTWIQTTSTDSEWYSYTTTDKKWANAQTSDGSMWVWIPRYAYKIEYLADDGSTVIGYSDSRGIVDTLGNVQEGTEKEGTFSVGDNYIVHPAFSYFENDRAISGIWVAKFEASRSNATSSSAGSGSTLKIQPGVQSWRRISVNGIFTTCQNYNTSLNSHMMKNSEWGAVAYLAQSEYGKNSEIWINPNSNYITGQAGTSVSASSTTSTYAYDNTTYGVNASTTGNIYGIYDMSGGAYEYVAAYVNNGATQLISNGSSLVSAPSYMKDVYAMGSGDTGETNYEANAGKYGDIMYETSIAGTNNTSWYGDASIIPYSTRPFFHLGGGQNLGSNSGIFRFSSYTGEADSDQGFRVILCIQ